MPGAAFPRHRGGGGRQRVQGAEEVAEPVEGPLVAARLGPLGVLGDQDTLRFMHGYRLGTRAPFGTKILLGQEAQNFRVALDSVNRPGRGEHAGHPARAVTAADAEHAQIKFGQPGDLDAVSALEMRGEPVQARAAVHPLDELINLAASHLRSPGPS